MQAVAAKLTSPRRRAGGIGALLKTVGMTLVSTVGGAAGPLYGTFFLRAASAAGKTALSCGPTSWPRSPPAWRACRQRGKAEPGDKTMVDALLPASEALATRGGGRRGLSSALRAAPQAAEDGMRATIPLVARKGRASYLGPRSAGHQDPGATSSWLLLKTAAETLPGAAAGGTTPGRVAEAGTRGDAGSP